MDNNGNHNSSDEYQITFKNGALANLKQLATKLNVSEDELDKVVEKGLNALQLSDDGILLFRKGGVTYQIDIKRL